MRSRKFELKRVSEGLGKDLKGPEKGLRRSGEGPEKVLNDVRD